MALGVTEARCHLLTFTCLRVDVDSDQVHVLGEFCIISGVDGKVVNLVGVCKSLWWSHVTANHEKTMSC
eukprot:5939802-Amphidinium_carterae.1